MFLVDTHCHLDLLKFHNVKEFEVFLKLCRKKNIKYMLSVSTNINNFLYIFSMFSYIEMIKLSCGIHPLYVWDSNCYDIFDLEMFINYKKIVAVGETGLDYENIDNNIKYKQIDFFKYHLYLSSKYNKPCIIHTRNSWFDTLNSIKEFISKKFKGIIHCFNYCDKNILYKFLDIGLYISISGLITFKNNFCLQNIIKYVPLDRLLVETDSPYLAPEPYRGSINTPLKIIFIIKKISQLKKISFYTVLKKSTENFLNLFKLK